MSRKRIISTRWLLFAGIPLFLLLSIVLAGGWLLRSEPGARWLWSQLEEASGNSLSAQRVEGDLASGLTINGLRYKTADISVAVKTTLVQAAPALWPLSVEVPKLLLQGVNIHHTPGENEQQGTAERPGVSAMIDALSLPLPLYLSQAKIEKLEYWQSDPGQALLIDSVGFSLGVDENLVIDQLQFDSQDLSFQGNAQLALRAPYLLTASSRGQFRPRAGEVSQSVVLPFELQAAGDLEKLNLRLLSDTLELDMSGELSELFTLPEWELGGVIGRLPEEMQLLDGEIVISGLDISSEGNPGNWSLNLSSDLVFGGSQTAEMSVYALGSASGMNVQQATVRGAGIELEVNGLLDWSNELEADLRAEIGQLDISPWLQDWPEGKYLNGNMELKWSEDGLKVPASRLTVSETEFTANVHADIDVQAGVVDAHLDWTDFNWPLASPEPVFDSRSGSLDIRGSIDQWVSNGDFELKVGDYPAGRFEINGEGDRGSAFARLLQGDVLGGQLRGSVEADWSNELKWALDLNAEGIDPEPLFAGWPGKLDGVFRVASDAPSMPVNVQIESLQGMLRGIPVKAAGKFGLGSDHAWFEQLVVSTDQASLRLDGDSLAKTGVSVDFSGQIPEMLLQGASGNLELSARLSNNPSEPLIGMQLQASNLAWEGLAVRSMEIATKEDTGGTALRAFDLNASDVRWKDKVIDKASVSLRGREQGYHLQASMESEWLDMVTGVELTPQDTGNLLKGRWTGLLSSLDLMIGEKLDFSLATPAAMSWADGAFSLETACLNETGGAGICAGLERDGKGDLSVTTDVTALPVDYLRHLYQLDVKFEQTLDGQLEWHHSADGRLTGGADLRITAGQVIDLVDNEPLLESKAGLLKFNLREGNLESGMLNIEFPGVGFIDVDFEVADIIEENGMRLTGRVISQLNNIELIGQLAFPGVDEVNGRLSSDLRLGGTLLDPQFDGGFSLTGGSLNYQPIGLKLEDVRLTGKVGSRDLGNLKGQFKAGEGIGVIDGRFVFDDPENMSVELNLSGDQLLLINTKALRVLSNVNLDLGLSPGRFDINGNVLVPSAKLSATNLLLETVSDSEDLVIENRRSETAGNAKEKGSGNRVFGTLEVAFGDDVKVKVPDINTSVHGSVQYRWTGDAVPVAEGVYEIDGSVDVYGPTLTINKGTISFPNVPADNPLLNIRAQRDIFGNTQIRSAGVQVIGTLKRPVLEAFTVPVTNEDRAWALLVTGSDFDQSQGVGGFDVGTYIAPRLYISYGISLFEDENVISARYDLKKGFGVKVTSGQRETGLDISYTIDR